MSVEVVKLQSRKVRNTEHYTLTVPKDFVRELGWVKGDRLIARVMELEVNGSKRKVLIYYKP